MSMKARNYMVGACAAAALLGGGLALAADGGQYVDPVQLRDQVRSTVRNEGDSNQEQLQLQERNRVQEQTRVQAQERLQRELNEDSGEGAKYRTGSQGAMGSGTYGGGAFGSPASGGAGGGGSGGGRR
jgi:hypothetical protein